MLSFSTSSKMANKQTILSLPEQIKESRKKIRDSFKRSHDALQMRENIILSRVDEIEKQYNSKTEKINTLVESLKQHKSIATATQLDYELNETYRQFFSDIDARISQLTTDIYTSIEFEWDNLFETGIEQLGSIKLNGQTMKSSTSIFPPHVKPVVPDYKTKQLPTAYYCKKSPGELNNPRGIAIHYETGDIYIADTHNNRVQVFTCKGEHRFMFSEKMNEPVGICITQNKVLVTQYNGHYISVYELDGRLIKIVGSEGNGEVQFMYPLDLDVSDGNNYIYVCECVNQRVQILTKEFKYVSMLGMGTLVAPRDVKVTRDKVLDQNNPCLFVFNSDHVLINRLITRGVGKQTSHPYCFDIDREHNITVSDYHNHLCMYSIRRENRYTSLERKVRVSGSSIIHGE